ncbi:MAG: hypothetical protein ACFNTM_01060 [Cardiobacterium sp.]
MAIAILTKPYTALRRFAVQPRTVFSGAPCIELCEYCYIAELGKQDSVSFEP